MPNISHIVAVDQDFCIGKENRLMWHIPEDLQRFKKLTQNCVVIMGRKTFESIGHALPDRLNIVLSSQPLKFLGAIRVTSIEEALDRALAFNTDIFIIGGEQIYRQTISMVNRIEITYVDTKINGDAFYLPIPEDFKLIHYGTGRGTSPAYFFETYQREIDHVTRSDLTT